MVWTGQTKIPNRTKENEECSQETKQADGEALL